MNITYLIGNGFDIGLGLKTRYSDFLSKYVSRSYVASGPVKWLIDQIKNAPHGTWADAEMAFGQLPFSKSGFDVGNTIRESLADFQKELSQHLETEARRLNIPSEERKDVGGLFLRSLVNSLLLLTTVEKSRAELHALSAPGTLLRINIINFNYTDSVAKLLGDYSVRRGVIKVNVDEQTQMDVVVNPICHVHGSLKEKSSVFGVDDTFQIADDDARLYCGAGGLLLKSEIDRSLDYGFEERARQMIQKSDRIVCFGLSYGATDLRWWDCICSSLAKNDKSRLLLMPYFDDNRPCYSAADQILIAQEVRDRFLASVLEANNALGRVGVQGGMDLRPRMVVAKHFPHFDFDNQLHHSDPFNLQWFGQKYVKKEAVA